MFAQHRKLITRLLIFAGALSLLIPAWLYGNALSIFLCLTLCCMLAYYFLWVNEENNQEKERQANESRHYDDKIKAENERILRRRIKQRTVSLALLTVLYIASVFVLRLFVRPGEQQPYFLNTDYHYIYNKGISFDKKLVLCTDAENPSAPGLWPSGKGTLSAVTSGDGVVLQGNDFLQPVFERISSTEGKDGFVYTPLYLPYAADVTNGFSFGNSKTKLTVFAIYPQDSSGLLHGHKDRTLFSGVFTSADKALLDDFGVDGPYTDTFHFYLKTYIKTGLSFRDLFIRPETWQSNKPYTKQLMSEWMENELGDCYLLADYKTVPGKKQFSVFPSAQSQENGCSLYTGNGIAVPLRRDLSVSLPYESRVYVGFAHEENNFLFTPDSTHPGAAMLVFNRPAYFALSTRMRGKAPVGTSFIRSLRNHYTGFINNPLNEGYLLREDLRQAYSNDVQGYITVVADAPGVPLEGKIHDGTGTHPPVSLEAGKTYSLQSAVNGIRWLYSIRDFSQHPLDYGHIFLLLTGLYLLICLTLLFFPSRHMQRLEPVLMYMLYAFIFVRCILLWRIATFPPAGDATPNEIDKYIAADMLRIGSLSLSTTACGLLAFFITVILYRFYQGKKNKQDAGVAWAWMQQPNKLVMAHLAVLAVSCLIVFTIGNSYEMLRRICSILIPVAAYLFFCYRLRKSGEQRAVVPKFEKQPWLRKAAAFFVRWYDSRETLLSIATFAALFIMDRGFAVLFLLFLLLKNIAVSFARIPFVLQAGPDGNTAENASGKLRDMFLKPRNYWIFGVLALVVYIIFLVYQGLFYQLLQHSWWVLAGIILLSLFTGLAVLQQKKRRLAWAVGHGVAALVLVTCFSWINGVMNNSIRHVKHRASLINRPVDSIIAGSRYSSFEERKILETAESQWFINSYLNKPYDRDRRLNLRPFFDQGVDYTTQTRDVVLPRFVIAEHGGVIMLFLLLLLGIPLVLYLASYRLYDPAAGTKPGVITPRAYAGTLSMILLFTIGLFVWLTATNRFVFFGQDFPFLSLASKVSVALPLLLLLPVLLGNPVRVKPVAIRMKQKWVFLLSLGVIIAVIVTLLPRQQSEKNFTVRIKQTDSLINGPVNQLLLAAQDTLEDQRRTKRNGHPDIYAVAGVLKNMPEFKAIADGASPYTRSILDFLVTDPGKAMQPESPVYLRFDADDNRYFVNFNRNLYLELPAYEGGQEWSGDIREAISDSSSNGGSVVLNGYVFPVGHLPAVRGNNAVRAAVLPAAWFDGRTSPVVLLSVGNAIKGSAAVVHVFPKDGSASRILDVKAFASEIDNEALVYVTEGGNGWQLRYNPDAGHAFAVNYYINGRQRLIYPLRERYPWLYQYARTAQAALTADSQYRKNVLLTLDYALTDTLDRRLKAYISSRYIAGGEKMPENFRLAVIAADGDGAIRAMNDYVKGRKMVDPNNRRALAALENDHFFRISSLADRRQWGNVNLIHMAKGPGSSLKPPVAAAVASGVHVEWGDMQLNDDVGAEITSYAGYDLGRRTWKSTTGQHEFIAHSFPEYLQNSVNLYHSLFIFLGSYPKEKFRGKDGRYSLRNLLTQSNDNGRNKIPAIYLNGAVWHLPSRSSHQWPATDPAAPASSNFGNERSLLAQSLAVNYGVFTGEDNKLDHTMSAQSLVDFADTVIYDSMSRKPLPGAVWSFPEQSMFLQAERALSANPVANFSEGLRNPTLGANPWHITPLKMAEMYGRLLTGNAAYSLHITPRPPRAHRALSYDSETWTGDSYSRFLKDYVFLGMENVLSSGTASALLSGRSTYTVDGQNFYCYAKTGTINDAGSKEGSSTRFAIVISKEDLRTETPAAPHIYTIYITCDKLRKHDFALYKTLIDAVTASSSFRKYMGLSYGR